jgi:hypothetical protein
MERLEFNLECMKTIDTKHGAVRAVRFNGKFDDSTPRRALLQNKFLFLTEKQPGIVIKACLTFHY